MVVVDVVVVVGSVVSDDSVTGVVEVDVVAVVVVTISAYSQM